MSLSVETIVEVAPTVFIVFAAIGAVLGIADILKRGLSMFSFGMLTSSALLVFATGLMIHPLGISFLTLIFPSLHDHEYKSNMLELKHVVRRVTTPSGLSTPHDVRHTMILEDVPPPTYESFQEHMALMRELEAAKIKDAVKAMSPAEEAALIGEKVTVHGLVGEQAWANDYSGKIIAYDQARDEYSVKLSWSTSSAILLVKRENMRLDSLVFEDVKLAKDQVAREEARSQKLSADISTERKKLMSLQKDLQTARDALSQRGFAPGSSVVYEGRQGTVVAVEGPFHTISFGALREKKGGIRATQLTVPDRRLKQAEITALSDSVAAAQSLIRSLVAQAENASDKVRIANAELKRITAVAELEQSRLTASKARTHKFTKLGSIHSAIKSANDRVLGGPDERLATAAMRAREAQVADLIDQLAQ